MTDATIRQIPIAGVVVGERMRSARDVGELSASIERLGLLHPITVHEDGRLISGHHRLRACEALGWTDIPARVVDYDDIDAELAEIDENLVRNELTELERGRHLGRRRELHEARFPETRNANERGGPGRGHKTAVDSTAVLPFTRDASTKLGVSESTVRQSIQIARDLSPDVQDAIRDTPLADRKDDLLKLSRMDADEQRDIAERITTGQAKNVKEAKRAAHREALAGRLAAAPPADERYTLHHVDIEGALEMDTLANDSLDLIITDPPYGRDSLECFRVLGSFAECYLKPGGSILAMSGQAYLPDVLECIGGDQMIEGDPEPWPSGLTYHWTLCYLTPGGQASQMWDRRVNTFWKPVFWFTKGKPTVSDWVGDVTKSDPNDNDKRLHEWGQSESGMRDLMRRFCRPGDVVCDPFMGAGTTGVIALELGCTFIGLDQDADAVAVARGRLAGCQK